MTHAPLSIMSTYGRNGSSTRVRQLDWVDYLGLDSQIFPFADTSNNSAKTLLRNAPRVLRAQVELEKLSRTPQKGTLVLGRAASPFSNGKLESNLLQAWEYSVYDFDDALFVPSGAFQERLWSKVDIWKRSVASADLVIAGSDFLAEHAASISSNVVMIPSCVDPDAYLTKVNYSIEREHPLAVWMGSPTTESFLTEIASDLLKANAKHGLRLRVISSGARDLGPLNSMVERVEWTADSFASSLADADFGIMPLPDTLFARGKCAYKLLQYGAAGLPVLADPVGANALALDRMKGISTSGITWFDALSAVVESNSDERKTMGVGALNGVVENYSFAAWSEHWVRAISNSATI